MELNFQSLNDLFSNSHQCDRKAKNVLFILIAYLSCVSLIRLSRLLPVENRNTQTMICKYIKRYYGRKTSVLSFNPCWIFWLIALYFKQILWKKRIKNTFSCKIPLFAYQIWCWKFFILPLNAYNLLLYTLCYISWIKKEGKVKGVFEGGEGGIRPP